MKQGQRRKASTVVASKSSKSLRLRRIEKSYPEIVQSVKSVSEEKRKINMPMGKKNIEESIIKKLSVETRCSPGRIKKFLVHSEYITDKCLATLSGSGADEDFFDMAQPAKRLLVKNLLDRGLGNEEIEGEISSALLEMWPEYKQTGKINQKRWMDMKNGVSKKKRTWKQGKETFGKAQILNYRPPNVDGPVPRPLEPKQISRRLENLAKEISEIARRTDGKQYDLIQEVGRLLTKMNRIHHSLLRGRHSTKGETDNATLH